MHTRLRWLIATVCSIGLLSGCSMTVYRAGDPDAAERYDASLDAGGHDVTTAWGDEPWAKAENWPERWAVWSGLKRQTLAASSSRPMGLIMQIEGPLRPMRNSPSNTKQLEAEQGADVTALMRRRRVRLGDTMIRFEGEGRGSYVFLTVPPNERGQVVEKATMYMKFISGREVTPAEIARRAENPEVIDTGEAPAQSSDSARLVQIERTWFVYYAPDEDSQAKQAGRPRGVAVVMPGMFGTPDGVVMPMVRQLRQRGWGVLRLLAHSSRFTEKITFTIDAATDVEAEGKRIAETLTGRAAECAYAVQAAMLLLKQERPETVQAPKVLIGMSGGAMILPTVMAREPDLYDAAVSIAGGVDYLRVALESNYTDWIDAVKFVFNGSADNPATRRELVEAYHRHAPLDSTQTAKVLRGKPVLMIHGAADRAVPAHLGDEMWRTAGMPERWVFSAGHEMLFFSLPMQMDRLMEWLEQNTPRNASGGAPQPRPSPAPTPSPASPAANEPVRSAQ